MTDHDAPAETGCSLAADKIEALLASHQMGAALEQALRKLVLSLRA